MKKSIISLIIVCCLVFALGVISTQAETYTGSYGDNVTYTLDTETGVLTISGTGDMRSYDAPWLDYKDLVKTVVIEDGVTSIGSQAFYECGNLTNITIPDGITSIGGFAFDGCSSLTEITIPESVTSIGTYAFYKCSSLTEITIPEGVTSIGDSAFYHCSGLKKITIPDSVTSIGDKAFGYCTSLKEITIPEGVTSIGDYAFSYCDSLTKITIPEGVTSIGDSAFYDCSGLTEITIPESVTRIGDSAFKFCNSLTEITIPEGVTSISKSAFEECGSLTSITIPKSVTKIGNYAFNYCMYLKEITIPEGVTSIGDYAFSSCISLKEITIPEGVTSIGDNAFSHCGGLTEMTIPKSVTNIGDFAFDSCNKLGDVYYAGTEADWSDVTIGDNNTSLTSATIHFKTPNITLDGEEVETDGSIVLGTDNGDGTYSLPGNVVGYYFDDKFVDAGVYDVTGGEVITTVDFNVTMVNGAQVRYGGGLDENGKVTSGNGLRFLAQVDRSSFDGEGYGMKLTTEGSTMETIVAAEKWQDDTTFTVALTDMAESNYIRKFTATPYVVVKYDDGTEKTIYGTQSVTRSIYNISAGLLTNDEEYADDLIAVLNAYVNQTGIRLVIGEIGGEIKAHSAKYGDTLHFAVSDAAYDSAGNAYSVILTAQGNAKIITDNDFWYEYIRINNNNSLVKDKVTVERVDGNNKAVKVTFNADGLIERPSPIPNEDDNITKDPADDDFDGESEWN